MIGMNEQVIEWNKARFEQHHSPQLTTRLLNNEVNDFVAASASGDEAGMLKALSALIFVSVGAMWHTGLTANQIEDVMVIICVSNDTKDIVDTKPGSKAEGDKGANFIDPLREIAKVLGERK